MRRRTTSEAPRRLFRGPRVSRRSFDRFVAKALRAIKSRRASARADALATTAGRIIAGTPLEAHFLRRWLGPRPRAVAVARAVAEARRTVDRQTAARRGRPRVA